MRISDWSSDVCSSDLGDAHSGKSAKLLGRSQNAIGGFDLRRSGSRLLRDVEIFIVDQIVADDNDQIRAAAMPFVDQRLRSEGRRGGKECVRTCRSRWWADH